MNVLSILYEALLGRKDPLPPRDVSLAGALTAGLFEVSQAMAAPGGDVQHSLDLIVSAATSILRMERCVLLLRVPGKEPLEVALRALAGVPRGRQFERYREEVLEAIIRPVFATGQGMILTERKVGMDRKLLRLMRRLDVKGFIVAPVLRSSGVDGILAGATPMDGRLFSDVDLKLLSVMANFAGVALENAALVSRLERKAKKLEAIFEIGKALNEERDPSVLFQRIVDRVTELLGASSGSMILVEGKTETLRIVAERGLGAGVKEGVRLHLGEGITGWVAKEGAPVLVPDVRKDDRYVVANPQVRSEMAVPIKWGEKVIGVINLDHFDVEAFSEEDLELLDAFGHAAAVAIRNARLLEEGE